jgi:hypothetical protein
MNLTEVLMAALVFALASSASVRLWGAGAAWSATAAERQQLLSRLDAVMLRRERALRAASAAAVAAAVAPMDCAAASGWLQAQLADPAGAAAEGVEQSRVVAATPAGEAVWLVLRVPEHGLERRRLFSPAAHGLCLPAGGETP